MVSVFGLLLAGSALAADPVSPGEILQKAASRYEKLRTYEIDADEQMAITRAGQMGSQEEKVLLAVGKQGMFRVERNSGGAVEIRVSDGSITWKALPKQKIWSKSEVAQMMDLDSDDAEPDESTSQDLFTETQRLFVARYGGLARYANAAVFEKTEKLKFNGQKVECYVVRISTNGSANRLYIAKDSFFVLRHAEVETSRDGAQIQVTIDYKKISDEMPSAELFEFQPPNGSKEVADVSLPSERNVSWVGRQAADFTLKTVDGSPVHLADLKGRVILLDFWATWCPPCRHELPTIEAISRKYKDKNVLVFGINDEDVQTAKRFLEKSDPDLATLHDAQGKIHKLYGCYSIPTVLIIDPAGKVVAHFIGERPENELVAALKEAGMK